MQNMRGCGDGSVPMRSWGNFTNSTVVNSKLYNTIPVILLHVYTVCIYIYVYTYTDMININMCIYIYVHIHMYIDSV